MNKKLMFKVANRVDFSERFCRINIYRSCECFFGCKGLTTFLSFKLNANNKPRYMTWEGLSQGSSFVLSMVRAYVRSLLFLCFLATKNICTHLLTICP